MRLAALMLTGLLGLTPAGHACEGRDLSPDWSPDFRAAVASHANAQPYAEGRFYEVQRSGPPSVIFGTIHLNTGDVATPPPDLLARLDAADELFIEVTEEEEKRMMRSVILNPGKLMAPEGKRLRQEISAQDWQTLEPLLADFGMTPEIADQIAPWYLTITLANPACLIKGAFTGEAILDRRIERAAKAAGTTVSGLETYEDVFGLFQTLPYDDQVRMLLAGLPTYALAEDYLETSKQMYLRGEIQQIWSYGVLLVEEEAPVEGAMEAIEQFFDRILVERNARWMDTLVPALDAGNKVVAVGALHLGGEAGLLPLLEAEGFSVRRLD